MRKLTSSQVKEFLSKYPATPSQRVLDIGAGAMAKYPELFPNTVTLDIEAEKHPNVVGDAHHLPFKDEEFDVVVCSEVFEHLEDPRMATSEIKRVLKPNGLLLLTTRFAFPVHDAPGDYWRFTPYILKELFKDWDMIEMKPEADALSTVAILLQRVIFQTKLRGGKITKGLLHLLALFLNKLDFLILERYGDIKRTSKVDILLSSGIFIACRKK